MSNKHVAGFIGFVLALAMLVEFDKLFLFGLTLLLLVVVLGVLYYLKYTDKKGILTGALVYFTVFFVLVFYLLPASALSISQGTVLSNNWWNALNWMKNNTEECGVVATYWDPGHFIVAVAGRPVVFDGAGQNIKFYYESDVPHKDGIEIRLSLIHI